MPYNPDIHHRHSIRLKDYDYAQSGAYFVTICTHNRECLLGEIVAGDMRVNDIGHIVSNSWQWLAQQHPDVGLDTWVVMPNHLHGIVVMGLGTDGVGGADGRTGGSRTAPTEPTQRKPFGRLIGAFKTVSTKSINRLRGTSAGPFWQRNYYERIIRDETELHRVREYIVNNPARWAEDDNYPNAIDAKVRAVREPSLHPT